jgi:Baseplate J-like protein
VRVLEIGDAPAFAALLRILARGYVPEWSPGDRGAGAALVQAAAHDLQAVAQRLERAPRKNELAFLELLGVRLVPAQPARAPLVLQLEEGASDVRMPAGTRISAAPPPGGAAQITFETERSVGVAVARLAEVRSLWPRRDEVCDHTASVLGGAPFTLFDPACLEPTPHHLYIAHDRLLALAGSSAVTVSFELITGSSEYLDLRWEYFDGAVWRPFRDMRPACSNAQAKLLDSTDGLRFSGAFRLETDCAETSSTTVGGISAHWVRARLEEPLPPDPERVLPELGAIKVSTEVSHAYADIWSVLARPATEATLVDGRTTSELRVEVLDASGVPLEDVTVGVIEKGSSDSTGDDGIAFVTVDQGVRQTIAVLIEGFDQQEVVTPPVGTAVDMTFRLDMAAMDLGVADGESVDLSKPFFPFGAQPQPGAAFYFSHAEAFSKPGARLRLYVQPAVTPQDDLGAQGTPQSHTLSWEYFDGLRWVSMLATTESGTETAADLRARGMIELTVPEHLEPTVVAEQEALWMRVRLVQGGYGKRQSITVGTGSSAATLKFFVPEPPSLADLRLGYTWTDGPLPPEHVLAYNDFAYVDQTGSATWPGSPWRPIEPVSDATPALYLGFDGRLPVDELGLWVDVEEERGETDGPTLVWEYSDGVGWQRLTVADGTHELRVPGIVNLIGPEDLGAIARFGEPRFWLRARLLEDGDAGTPTIRALMPNATWVTQRQTVVDEPLGAGSGEPGQVLTFRQVPVLPGQLIEVRELEGRRAEVEWRILAAGLLPDPDAAIAELEAALAAEGETTEFQRGPLRIVRDRYKHVVEAWVRWEEQPTLGASGTDDRHYALDRARGRVHFGPRVPPRGAAVAARLYRTGGGRAGNVPARAITQLQGPVGGVERVFNPTAAEGGADTETADRVLVRGPLSVRARGRAATAADLETLALEASPSVAVARAIPARNAAGRRAPGWVTLVITPHSAEPRPFPTFGLREAVRTYVAARAPADLPADRIVVMGPDYLPVDVTATIVPVDPGEAGAVERAAHDALATFLHPLLGGPSGRGWAPGLSVFASDVAAVIEHLDSVDYTRELALLRDGVPAGERLDLPADRIPVAGALRLGIGGA